MSGPTINLHEYQRFAKDFIKNKSGCGLFFDMGLGKTLITLIALWEMNPQGHVLVVAPKTIARSTWIDEIKKWRFSVRTKSFIVDENDKELSRKQRLDIYAAVANAPPTVYFINRELLTDLIKHMPIVNKRPTWCFPYVVVDELQSFKNHASERFKSMKKVRPQIKWFLGLTGTPSPNGPMDLWAQIYLMDQGERLGKNITAYRNEFFTPGLHVNGYPVKWNLKPGAKDEIYRRISDIVISQENTVLQLPPLTINDIQVYMTPKEKNRYKQFVKDKVLPLTDNITVIAKNQAVLQGKLSQMASGAIYVDDKHNFKIIHLHKLDACEYIIENTNSPVLIAYYFQSDKEMLLNYLSEFDPQVFDGSKTMIDKWNNEQFRVMLIQPKSAAHGVNLQHGGHTLVWYTMPWGLEDYAQMNGRLYRQGQTKPVIIHRLMTHETIDNRIPRVLEAKDQSEQELLQAVKLEIQMAATS